jgi:hypothetical protein
MPCADDYARVLAADGIRVQVRRMGSLTDLSRIADLPAILQPRHLLLVGGYVVVDHVPPEAITKRLAARPKVTGLLGAPECYAPSDHARLHAVSPRTF